MVNIGNMSDSIQTTREFRMKLLNDRYRPSYHFAIPEDLGLPGDPNGAFYANGRYHLMYLYDNRSDGFRWGHISSLDLIHWRHHPDAIIPGGGDGGCFSGGAFVDDDNTVYLTYWGLPVKDEGMSGSGICIAKSSDRHYEKWEKFDSPVLQCNEDGIHETVDSKGEKLYLGCADPSNIWKKDGVYYMQTGNLCVLNKYGRDETSSPKMKGDWVDLFQSKDLKKWDYVDRFYQRDMSNKWTDESEDDMCPSFLPLPVSRQGGSESGKHLQLFISHNKGCQYYIGSYTEDELLLETHGRMSWVDNTFFAPEALIDDKGRQIMWAWLLDNPADELQNGWSGVFGLPRTLWLGEDNTLRMAPVDELKTLRYNEKRFSSMRINDGDRVELSGINGESSEIKLVITPGSAKKMGLKVRASADEEEETLLYYDTESNQLVFDSTKSGVMGRMVSEAAPFKLNAFEKLELTIFIDKSVIEVFANDRQAITRRVYPVRLESTGVYLFSEGGDAAFDTIQVWEMMPSNPY
ncbi:glycoside hydrolase family 32 protein [Paenibacillus spongiae]|uniref:beta-fructofuranosidase n=1 Tax=Paenibacillus spongiae TaxID=2909671 RepID=A0ABY5SJL4_9BACL|nr:glycoside hydrolase family 32 protein [Paenibacillus spongiae]UVI32793.1 glycoside hydrolase family 32 protein [Paenibacillus spongiae]